MRVAADVTLASTAAAAGQGSSAIADAYYAACGVARIAAPAPQEPFVGPFVARDEHLRVWNGSHYEPMFLKGVNLGLGLPGKGPTEYAITADQYARWLAKMSELGINLLRVYTLHPPAFYDAVAAHNCAHPTAPVYIMHGVWLRDPDLTSEETRDLEHWTTNLDASTAEVVDAVHGNLEVPERKRLAWGKYTTDISPWVLGYLVGREVLAEEVKATNTRHPTETSFRGGSLALAKGNPASVWVTARLDHAVTYERARYGSTRPVGFSNWLETDPMKHPTESPSSGKDSETIDTSKVTSVDAPAGVFASFHVYPYYPDFMSEDPGYRAFSSDACGENSYRGYLHDLKRYHGKMPVIVGEFGVPASWGNAKFSTNGMHHGGHSEDDQAKFTVRMVESIAAEGLAGAVAFGWMDGWFKQVWITREMTNAERSSLWHDATNPQQYYGLLSFDLPPPDFAALPTTKGSGRVTEIAAAADAEFFHVKLALASPLADGETLTIGFDTYGDDVGELVLPDGARTKARSELALTVSNDGAQLSVTKAYDLYGINRKTPIPGAVWRSVATDGAGWSPVRRNNAVAHKSGDGLYSFPARDHEIGKLVVRREGGSASSLDAVVFRPGGMDIRIPWSLLQFMDPSTRSVMNDDLGTPDVKESAVSEGIRVVTSLGGELVETPRLAWSPWKKAPSTLERYRPAAAALASAYARVTVK